MFQTRYPRLGPTSSAGTMPADGWSARISVISEKSPRTTFSSEIDTLTDRTPDGVFSSQLESITERLYPSVFSSTLQVDTDSNYHSISDGLIFGDSVSFFLQHLPPNTVAFADSASARLAYRLSISDTLAFIDSTSAIVDHPRAVDTVAFTDDATNTRQINRSVVDHIFFGDKSRDMDAQASEYYTYLGPVQTFDDEFSYLGPEHIDEFDPIDFVHTASDEILFTDTALRREDVLANRTTTMRFHDRANVAYDGDGADDIAFTDTSTVFDHTHGSIATVSFTDSVDVRAGKFADEQIAFTNTASATLDTNHPSTDTLAFTDTASAAGSTHNVDATDAIVFSDTPHRVKLGDATDTVAFSDTAIRLLFGFGFHALAFVDTAEVDRSTPATHRVAFVDLASAAGSTFNLSATDQIAFGNGTLGLGTSVSGITSPCGDVYAGLGSRTGVILTYPFISPSLTFNVRNPKFGNILDVDIGIRKARYGNGQSAIARKSLWPQIKRLKVSFEALLKADRDAFIAFLVASQGDEVGYLDHEDRQWRGVIISTSPFGEDGIDRISTGFEFQGRLA